MRDVLSGNMIDEQGRSGQDGDGRAGGEQGGGEVRLPLFERAVSRRAVLLGSAALGAVFVAPALACGGTSDKAKFDTATTAGPATTAAGVTSTSRSGGGAAIPTGGSVAIDFTYAFSGGMAKNPYIAVWVETAAGDFVDTVSLWYQKGKGDKWLPDMRAWVSASGGGDTSMSSATRTAGAHSVVWDGNDATGARAAQGEYLVFIECAREKGPYSVISVPITCGTAAATASGTDKGEISKVAVAYRP